MSDFEKHIPYFSTVYNLYQSAPNASKPEILKSLIKYGNFPAFINYLNQVFFPANATPKTATNNMEFLMHYFQKAQEENVEIDLGNLSEIAQFFVRIFYQKAQPLCYKEYGEFLFQIFTKLKELDSNSIYDILIKCSYESAIFPLSVFGVVNEDCNSKILKLLFSLNSISFQKKESKITWIESFIFILSYPIKKLDHYSQKIISKIDELLKDSTIITDQKLRLLYSTTKSLKSEQVKDLFQRFYSPILKNISPKIGSEGITYIFKVSEEYYKLLSKGEIDLVMDPLFTNSLPFFFNSKETEKEAVNFCSLIEQSILQKYIVPIVEDASFVRASLFLVSHFPTEKTIHFLFKPISNQIYLNAQREAIIYFLSHFTCPPHHLSIAFTILKASDLEENESIDKIIDSNPVLYCSSVIKFITFCIDGIEKVLHFSDVFLRKKTIPIVQCPKHLNHSVLTLSVHFFGYKKHVKSISALICYLKACKENGGKSEVSNTFDYFASYNDESHVWPNFVHDALTGDDEWREELCTLSLQRLGKQEFQQCIILAAISKDPMILHNSSLLLIKDIKMMQILFTASSTNWEKETLNEIKNLVKDYSKDQEQEAKRGFFSSLFSRGSNSSSDSNYKPKIDIYTVVLNLFPAITQVLPYSNSLFDLLFTVFPSDQKPQYMTLTCKAIISVCQLIEKDERKIIHSIIDRLCNSNLSLCDFSVFEAALIKTLSVNQSMTEELALKIASLYVSLVSKKQISDESLFEETFLSNYYGDLTLNAFVKVLLSNLPNNEGNEPLFGCFYRMLKVSPVEKISYFQIFDYILISNLYSSSNFIRKICYKSLNLIEQLNVSQNEISRISKINSNDPNVTSESLLYFWQKMSKEFVDCLSKKFSYKMTIKMNELLFNHFMQTTYNNQVSILNFFNSVLSLNAEKYINDDSNQCLQIFFKLARKADFTNFNVSKCFNNIYTEILVCLAKVNSNKFIPLLLEQTSVPILNENHLNVLFNVETFIPLFIDAFVTLSKFENNEALPSVEVISRATQILLIIVDQRDAVDLIYHHDLVMLFIILLCLTSATFSKWTSAFKSQHLKNIASLFIKFTSIPNEEAQKFAENNLNNMNEGGIAFCSSKTKYQLYFNLLKIIQMLLERTEFDSSILAMKLNETSLHFMYYFCIAIEMKNANSSEDFESNFKKITEKFEDKAFVTEILPSILFFLSDGLTLERLKELRKNSKENLLTLFESSIIFFENYKKFNKPETSSTKDESLAATNKKTISLFASLSSPSFFNSTIKLNSILFMRIVLVNDRKFIKTKIVDILKVMNNFVIYDPTTLGLVELSATLLKVIKIAPKPLLFISHFNLIVAKMTTSIISRKNDSRQIACYFLSSLIKDETSESENNANDDNVEAIRDNLKSVGQIDFRALFEKVANFYVEADKSYKRYIEIAKSVLETASLNEKVTLEDVERMAAVIAPLAGKKNDENLNEKEIISKFVDFLRNYAVTCDVETLGQIIKLITEFTAYL